MSVSAADIEVALREALAPTALAVQDDSHLHAGHADALRNLIPRGIHALAIDARAPGDP